MPTTTRSPRLQPCHEMQPIDTLQRAVSDVRGRAALLETFAEHGEHIEYLSADFWDGIESLARDIWRQCKIIDAAAAELWNVAKRVPQDGAE